MIEGHLAQIERLMRENGALIERQRELISRMERNGPPLVVLAIALEFLGRLERFQSAGERIVKVVR